MPGIIQDLLTGETTSFSCHKTVYHPKHGGTWVEGEAEDGEGVYQAGSEKQCAGSLIMMQRFGHETQRMQVMRRMGVYKPTDFEPYRDLVIDPADVKIACKTK
ncbi:hypothetical protein D9M68_504510 [compost metagenome]